MLADSQPDDVSEEELIALAIAASLSECQHACAVHSPADRSHACASEGREADAASSPGWVTLGSSPETVIPSAGAWGRGAPRIGISTSGCGADGSSPTFSSRGEPTAGQAGSATGEELQTPAKKETSRYAEFIGTGHEGCANEDEAIVGAPLSEIAAQRVVRFRVPLMDPNPRPNCAGSGSGADAARPEMRDHSTVAARRRMHGGSLDRADTEENVTCSGSSSDLCEASGCRGGGGDSTGAGEAAGESVRWVVHGYDAMSLARWLLRDQRLPLTGHRLSEEDVGQVWRVFLASAEQDELDELEGCGEVVRDKVTGELRRADAEGKCWRLGDAREEEEEAERLACLDWHFFLAEIVRLNTQVDTARNLLLRDRSFAKRRDAQV
jgi:hypothetical protein